MNRKELKVVVESAKNPSFDEALVLVAGKFKASPENIVVKKVKGKFGRDTFLIEANIYKTKEDKEKFEPKKKVKKVPGQATEEEKK